MSRPRGLHLAARKTRPFERPLQTLPSPRTAVLALDQGSGATAEALVGPGDAVRVGTRVAAGREGAADLHSPISGTVRGIVERPILRGRGPCVVVEGDGRDAIDDGFPPVDWRSLDAGQLLERIAAAGIAGLGGAAFPCATKLALARAAGVRHLLLNGAECEPWICCDDALMRERPTDVVAGAQVMLAATGAERCTIGIEDDKAQSIAAVQAAIESIADARIAVSVLPTLFPLGAEGPLVTALTGREVPEGGLPPDVGAVCQNVGTAAAVARLVLRGEPLLSRIVTVTGSGVRAPANVEARIGTPISELIEACGGYSGEPVRLVAGGSLTGLLLEGEDVAVSKGLNCVLVATDRDLPPRAAEVPCIRCGDCISVCPAGLLPQQLLVAARSRDTDALARYGLGACIECGCCDYVCPSSIPLTSRFRDARRELHLQETDRRRALDARVRYERHRQRLADEADAERREFDAARRHATDEPPRADRT